MGKRERKPPGALRAVFAANVRELMAERYASSANKPMALAKGAGISLSTVQRLISEAAGPTLENLEAVALALGVAPGALVSPNRGAPDGLTAESILTIQRVDELPEPYRMQLLGRLMELEGQATAAKLSRLPETAAPAQSPLLSDLEKERAKWNEFQAPKPPKRRPASS